MQNMNYSKLYFRCKRGILELDIILFNFLKKKPLMNFKEQEDFCLFLEETDVNLYNWLVKKEHCPDEFLSLVNQINTITCLTLLR